ncbi:MAG: hypothetical protein GY792_12155 [Gammaproteobacteria bacterium]|nr:hypothetical protein [Gammaproteobacteria bacterium]
MNLLKAGSVRKPPGGDADPEDLHHLAQEAIGHFASKVYDGVLGYGEIQAKAISWRKDREAFLARLEAIRAQQFKRFQEHLAALAGYFGTTPKKVYFGDQPQVSAMASFVLPR